MKLTARDRILILAPHPDDESLATGGLIQRAVAARAATRVVFVTDGDDNPWPQRFIERRLNISTADRLRWGRRRREESLAAIVRLGLPKRAAQFLSMPDQGMTHLLLSANENALRTLSREVERWSPTLLVVPSGADTHPDHNALFVLTQLALARLENAPKQLRYLVHFPRKHSEHRAASLSLHDQEITVKREAILCHATQVKLSRKRFIGYAKPKEIFYAQNAAQVADKHHPVIAGMVERGGLRLQLRLPRPRARFAGLVLFVAFESLVAGSVRWSLTLPAGSRRVRIENAISGEPLRAAAVRIRGRLAEIALPVAAQEPLRQIFVKVQRRALFFDDSGWREIPVNQVAMPVPTDSLADGGVLAAKKQSS